MEHALVEAKKLKREKRTLTIKTSIIAIICLVIIAVLTFVLFNVDFEFISYNQRDILLTIYLIVITLLGMAVVFPCLFVIFTPQQKNKEDVEKFKIIIVKALIRSCNEYIENIKCFFDRGIDSSSYDEAEFEKYDKYYSEDLMIGTLKNNCNFKMSEVLTEYLGTDNRGRTAYYPLFHGMFAKAVTQTPFKAGLYLSTPHNTGLYLRGKSVDELKVDLDSQEFEKYFDVYCINKIIAMQLLTADVMQMLVDFRKEMDMEYEVTIKYNCIYIRFMSGVMFEVSNKFLLDKKLLYKYYRTLRFLFALTNRLADLIKETENII